MREDLASAPMCARFLLTSALLAMKAKMGIGLAPDGFDADRVFTGTGTRSEG